MKRDVECNFAAGRDERIGSCQIGDGEVRRGIRSPRSTTVVAGLLCNSRKASAADRFHCFGLPTASVTSCIPGRALQVGEEVYFPWIVRSCAASFVREHLLDKRQRAGKIGVVCDAASASICAATAEWSMTSRADENSAGCRHANHGEDVARPAVADQFAASCLARRS